MREETQKKFDKATLLLSLALPATGSANAEFINAEFRKISSAFRSIINDLEAEIEDLRKDLASALQQINP